jgi:predicted RNA methylase
MIGIVAKRKSTRSRPLCPDVRLKRKAELGQVMTPMGIAKFMASLFTFEPNSVVRVLDAGAGKGRLSAAFIEEWEKQTGRQAPLHVAAYEVDPLMTEQFRPFLDGLVQTVQRLGGQIDVDIVPHDFIQAVANPFEFGNPGTFSHAILNPPYKKITSDSAHRKWLRDLGIETVNLYSGFVAVALQLLKPGGQLVAIIPRSFCNGPYYRPFRELISRNSAIAQIHLFESRSEAFKDDGVLQENVIVKLVRGGRQGSVVVSTSRDDSFSDYKRRQTPFDRVVHAADKDHFIRFPPTARSSEVSLPFRHPLSALGLKVSTGPVVDFRLKNYLLDRTTQSSVPLIHPCHFAEGKLRWPDGSAKKKCAILNLPETRRWLYPAGCYVVTRRLSSKEESRRIVASIVPRDSISEYDWIGFENHLNVFHVAKAGLDEDLARGLCVYLNSTEVDRYFRAFNGHTQVNATDLRKLPYPSVLQLVTIGKMAARLHRFSQEQIDSWVEILHEG